MKLYTDKSQAVWEKVKTLTIEEQAKAFRHLYGQMELSEGFVDRVSRAIVYAKTGISGNIAVTRLNLN